MCIFKKFIALITTAVISASSIAEDYFPGTFEAEYALYSMGAKIAWMHRMFSKSDNGEFNYRSETRVAGLLSLFRKDHVIEESNWSLEGGTIKPLRYIYTHTGTKKERNVDIRFNWESGQITNSVNGSSWHMATRPGILDKLVYQLAIMRDLKMGKSPLEYAVADGGKVKIYDFELLGEEILKTPLGELHTLKLTRHKPNSRRETTLWCASELHYLPVRVENIEKDGRKTIAVINSLTGLQH